MLLERVGIGLATERVRTPIAAHTIYLAPSGRVASTPDTLWGQRLQRLNFPGTLPKHASLLDVFVVQALAVFGVRVVPSWFSPFCVRLEYKRVDAQWDGASQEPDWGLQYARPADGPMRGKWFGSPRARAR